MCGIAGVLSFELDGKVEAPVLDRMTDVLAHRGPDGRGTYLDGPLGLGHRRLAIIDLSADAAQPLASEDGAVQVVVNGEIYNYRELREQLLARGHRFRSRCDSEVLVHLYEEEGVRMVERLRGMFAFALWDSRRRRLLLARDRFGQKPLYYRLTERRVHFGSEIKAILQDPGIPREPDLEALDAYLTYGYVPAPATAFVGIKKLLPGHYLTIEADGRHRLESYWRLPPPADGPRASPAASLERAAERVLELLDESTRLRMISDVPLGALLSGGIDSSAVVASMCAARSGGRGTVKTFAVGFRETGFDESAHAREVARHLGTDHYPLELTPDAFIGLERVAWHYGEPFADSSCLPTFAICGLARRQVTVALTGDGGDELFGGYRRYLASSLEQRLRGLPAPVRALARSAPLRALLHGTGRKALAGDLERSHRFRELGLADGYVARLELISPELKSGLYRRLAPRAAEWDPRRTLRRAIGEANGEGSFAARCARADAFTYLPDDILTKVDVASMAHGLECRAPLLDHKLAEYVAGLPFAFKLAGWQRKVVLKRAVAARLPAWVLARRKKGFSVPLDSWFRGRTESLLRGTLLSARALERGYFEPAAIERLIDDHLEHGGGQAALFALLMLEHWHRHWIDPPAGRPLELSAPAMAATA